MQTALEEARASLAALKEGDGSKQQESNDLKREAAKIQRELSAKETNVEVCPCFTVDQFADAQSLAGRGEALRAKVSNSRHKVDEAKSSLAADKSENAVLASLNKLKAQGRIKGFHVSRHTLRKDDN